VEDLSIENIVLSDALSQMTTLPGLLAELEMRVMPATKNEAVARLSIIIERFTMLKVRVASLGGKKREVKRRIRF
jgi:hypothetical protein